MALTLQTLPATGLKLGADAVTTYNGVADAGGGSIELSKVGWGAQGSFNDISFANPMPVFDPDVTASGSLAAAAQTVPLALNGDSAAAVQISGTWVGTITFEGTLDSVAWFSINGVSASTNQPQPMTTVNGLYRLTPGGLSAIRANMTAFTSGSAAIVMRASAGVGGTFANQILPTKNTDGTSTQAIKAASTAAVAADAAAVVGLSPNSNTITPGPNLFGTASFTANDAVVAAPIGDGTLVSGASTAGSVISLAVNAGYVAWTLLIKNYVAGTVYTEASANTTNGTDGDWVEVKGRKTGTAVGVESVVYAMTSNGYWRGNSAGFTWIRARIIGASGGFPAISWMLSQGMGATFLNSGLPTSGSVIGLVGQSGAWNIGSLPTGANLIGDINARQFVASGDVSMQAAAVAVGNGTILPVTGYGTSLIQITGTFVGTIAFEGTEDGTNYVSVAATQLGASSISSIATAPGIYRSVVAGLTNIRARISAYTSGSITALGRTTNATHSNKFIQLVAGANIVGKFGIDQSTPGTTNAVSMTNTTFSVTNAGTFAVQATGAFFQATQPVSIATMPSTPVTGTFFQATQPVSIATNTPDVTDRAGRLLGQVTNAGTFAVQAAATLAAETTKVIGTVNVAAGQTIGATQGTAAAVAGAWTVKITDGTNTVAVKAASTAAVATDPSQVVSLSPNNPIPTGTNSIGNIGTVATVSGVTTVSTVTSVAASTPAITTTTAATLSSAATTNATSVKASAGNLYSVTASNVGAAAAFLKLFNLAAAPTVGTSVPFLTIPLPASGVVNIPFGAQGMRMATGIAFSITNLVADSDATAIAAAQVKIVIAYI